MRNFITYLVLGAAVVSCSSPQKFSSSSAPKRSELKPKTLSDNVEPAKIDVVPLPVEQAGTSTAVPGAATATASAEPEPTPTPTPDLRTFAELICQEGPRVSNAPKKEDFTGLFNVICTGGTTNDTFKSSLSTAFAGAGEPAITVIENKTGDLFVTRLVFLYTVRVPLVNPSAVQDINLYAKLAQAAVTYETSKLGLGIDGRKTFPGRGSLEEVGIHYDMTIASGAGTSDHRHTAINTYLLRENLRDVMVASEYMLEPEKNDFYHTMRGIQVMIKAPEGEVGTDLVYVNELVIKNRIDPNRVSKTVLDLSKAIEKLIYQAAVK